MLPDGVSDSPQPTYRRWSRTKLESRKDSGPLPIKSSQDIFCLVASFAGLTQMRMEMISDVRGTFSSSDPPHHTRAFCLAEFHKLGKRPPGRFTQVHWMMARSQDRLALDSWELYKLAASRYPRHRVHSHSSSLRLRLSPIAIHPTADQFDIPQ